VRLATRVLPRKGGECVGRSRSHAEWLGRRFDGVCRSSLAPRKPFADRFSALTVTYESSGNPVSKRVRRDGFELLQCPFSAARSDLNGGDLGASARLQVRAACLPNPMENLLTTGARRLRQSFCTRCVAAACASATGKIVPICYDPARTKARLRPWRQTIEPL
jgi:hypothetical protein